ncbi:hypothetical protein BKA66DRAFT_512961 [Pyrenochaeta sp. MPI-SDFR-AT-0127]|nr:hypothetical protein BKA66DRAFT_512961 [Pyrenochaeta sp. MPI-SDFR-AT-0127]
MSHKLNPIANNFTSSRLKGTKKKSVTHEQVSAPPYTYLDARIFNLEEEHANLRDEIDTIKELYHELSCSVGKLQKGGWPVRIGPFQEVDLVKSQQSAARLKLKLEKLGHEVRKSIDGVTDTQKANFTGASNLNDTMHPHQGGSSVASNSTISKSLPPHLRGALTKGVDNEKGFYCNIRNLIVRRTQERFTDVSPNNGLVTDGPIDPVIDRTRISALNPGSPACPTAVFESKLAINVRELSLDNEWKPHYLSSLSALPSDILRKIPTTEMVTFHPDFINNTLDGLAWSPGLRYIKGRGTCLLKNRTYYILDPRNEPFLPKSPGEHGAKLTAFFNQAPEEKFGDLEDGANSYEDVPMFVEVKEHGRVRYMYYGNYSQTRWSDKLDYDTMMARIPQGVKEYWATELTAVTREDWVTEELKKHFFKMPEYSGRLFAAPNDETTITAEEEVIQTEKMTKDVKKYVVDLREWEREATMKTAMIRKDFILQAFETADADDPPALRLWWEYLQCVDWRKDFYDVLVTLQSREEKRYLL